MSQHGHTYNMVPFTCYCPDKHTAQICYCHAFYPSLALASSLILAKRLTLQSDDFPFGSNVDLENGEEVDKCGSGHPCSHRITDVFSSAIHVVTHRRNQRSPSPYLQPQMPERGHRKRGIFLSSITVVATTWKEERSGGRAQKEP